MMLSLFSTSGKLVVRCDTVSVECHSYTLSSSGVFHSDYIDIVLIPDDCTFDVVWKRFTKALFITASFRMWSSGVPGRYGNELRGCTDVQSFQLAYAKAVAVSKPHELSTTQWQALANKFDVQLDLGAALCLS